MATATKIGPNDHGRRMSYDEFLAGDYELGYKYEIIDGKLYVSPLPNVPEDWAEKWLYKALLLYSLLRPHVLNYVTNKARVFVPGRRRSTVPEPDVAAYRDFPVDRPIRTLRWQEVHPILVAEVLSEEDPNKDLVRNVDLYLHVPSIREYWVLDTREDPEKPRMTVYRRHGARWKTIELAYGETYTTRLLPGFELTLDPRK